MEALEFIAAVIGDVLSWPVVVLVVAVTFRKPLGDLISRVRSYEGVGGRVTFGEELEQTEAEVDRAVAEAPRTAATQDEAGQYALAPDPNVNPGQAVVDAWEALETALEALLTARLGRARLPGEQWGTALARLRDAGVVNDSFVRAVVDLRRLRNSVAHGEHNPTSGEAAAYVKTARELTRAAPVLARTPERTP